ncbi:MAG: hypothetical protein WCG83_04325 [Candidatus Peregrinibacteria bacterium]
MSNLTPEQLKTGIAYFTLLMQIQKRLDIEDNAQRLNEFPRDGPYKK